MVVKYQNIILIFIGAIAICVLSYLGYQNLVYQPKAQEAISELNQAQYYFDLAVNNDESDFIGRVDAIMIDDKGVISCGADPRGDDSYSYLR